MDDQENYTSRKTGSKRNILTDTKVSVATTILIFLLGLICSLVFRSFAAGTELGIMKTEIKSLKTCSEKLDNEKVDRSELSIYMKSIDENIKDIKTYMSRHPRG